MDADFEELPKSFMLTEGFILEIIAGIPGPMYRKYTMPNSIYPIHGAVFIPSILFQP